MAKRVFKLPGIQDLSKDQEDARALPKNGQHLIIGGPGTGKSVLALLRSRRHHQDKEDYIFLVYNKLLNQASRQLFGAKLESQQWQSWFMKLFFSLTEKQVPRLSADNGSNWEEIDWDGVLAVINDLGSLTERNLPFLVIDEGQDMPPQFYQALANLGFEKFYVVADQNQQIEPDKNSTRQEIQDSLAIDPNDVIELQHNYRNTYSIARLAREFYTGDPASPPPNLPKSKHSAKRPILFESKHSQFQQLIGRILKMADLNQNRLIGIITPNNKVRKRYVNALMDVDVQLDNKRPRIETYQSGKHSELSFDEGGIMVINAQSCKGLEFDTVFLADINEHYLNPRMPDQKKRLFYVMVARAIDHVIMLKEAGKHCPVEAILPKDPDVLERK
ncbi:3'-5' exonuclease [endosymbiont of Lamellibrachia barhami]|uniref:3'-5' exonuclease n=1 Tax=endosymbiont of Lamellibrachia barhami TaxID=205975 RepID=UPI0015ACDA18|nr:3'-5' exonuclease [endosymbiont of Lamellibrachia barhami]